MARTVSITISGDASSLIRALHNVQGGLDDLTATGVASTSKLNKAFDGLKSAGTAGLLGIGTVLATVGVGFAAAAKEGLSFADSLNASMESLEKQVGASTEEMAEFKDAALEIFSSGFGEDIDDIAESMVRVTQATDAEGAALKSITTDVLILRDKFDQDLTTSVDSIDVLMEKFGITSDKAMQFIVAGLQNGLDKTGDFQDSIREYSSLFAQGGGDVEQFFSLLSTGLEGGVLGTDKAADLFKEFSIRIADGSDTTADAVGEIFALPGMEAQLATAEELVAAFQAQIDTQTAKAVENNSLQSESHKQMISSLTEGHNQAVAEAELLKNANTTLLTEIRNGTVGTVEAFELVNQALSSVEDPIERNRLGVMLMGTQFEDLGASAVENITLASGNLEGMANELDDIRKPAESFQASIDRLGKQFLVSIEPAAQEILPLLGDGLRAAGDFLAEASPIFKEFAVELGDKLGPAMEIIVDALSRIGMALGITTDETSGLDIALGLLEGTLDLIVTGIEAVAVVAHIIADAFEQARALKNQIDIISSFSLGEIAGAAGIPGFAQGGSFTVPPGFPNDSFMMGVSSGERVDVSTTNNFTFNTNSPAETRQNFHMARAMS